MKKAVCLLSGGLDSATTLFIAQTEGYAVTALTLFYEQIHDKEIGFAKQIADDLAIPHHVISISLPWGGSSLLDRTIPIPTDRTEAVMNQEIPSTYVPARNTIFLSLAASCAEAEKADSVFIGANALDYSGYPDCRPEYFESFSQMIQLGTKSGIEGKKLEIKTPLIQLSKKEIILLGKKLGVPFEKTWSCYKGTLVPCQQCDSCKLRAKGFQEAGFKDPLLDHATSSVR
jgi:7-cyano-7-deazaguanine synthase